MTTNDNKIRARELASRPYSLFIFLDQTTEDDTIFVATNPELRGCYAQGDTMRQAEEILAEVREDYITHLLANNLSIPEPIKPRHIGRPTAAAGEFNYRIIRPEAAGANERPPDVNLQMAVFA